MASQSRNAADRLLLVGRPPVASPRTAKNWRVERERGPGWQRPAALPGDFNGDGRTDILIRERDLRGWWIAYSTGDTAVERSVRGPFPLASSYDAVVVGDVDGDGLDDVLGWRANQPAIDVSDREQNSAFRPARARRAIEHTIKSDASGDFESGLCLRASMSLPYGERVHIFPPRRTIQLDAARQAHHANFLAVRTGDGAPVGRSIHVGPVAGPYAVSDTPRSESGRLQETLHAPPDTRYTA